MAEEPLWFRQWSLSTSSSVDSGQGDRQRQTALFSEMSHSLLLLKRLCVIVSVSHPDGVWIFIMTPSDIVVLDRI